MIVRLTQIDGKLPNLALMKLAHWHKAHGDEVHFTRSLQRTLVEPAHYDVVYGSAIFGFSAKRVEAFRLQFPNAVLGGTWNLLEPRTVEQHIGVPEYEHYDYDAYPDFDGSIGFTARGCRLRCKFCVVPEKEGRPRSVNTIADIWRGGSYPKHLHLLDNDFFGQAREQWVARVEEILSGKFKVCFNQGINIRLITDEAASWIAKLPYYDDSFTKRRLYTAWDNLKDEAIFFRGVDNLERHGVSPKHLMVYMLVGYDPAETWERILYRYGKMSERGINPYPMVYNNSRRDLKQFQRWAIRYSRFVPWPEYNRHPDRYVQTDPGLTRFIGLDS